MRGAGYRTKRGYCDCLVTGGWLGRNYWCEMTGGAHGKRSHYCCWGAGERLLLLLSTLLLAEEELLVRDGVGWGGAVV